MAAFSTATSTPAAPMIPWTRELLLNIWALYTTKRMFVKYYLNHGTTSLSAGDAGSRCPDLADPRGKQDVYSIAAAGRGGATATGATAAGATAATATNATTTGATATNATTTGATATGAKAAGVTAATATCATAVDPTAAGGATATTNATTTGGATATGAMAATATDVTAATATGATAADLGAAATGATTAETGAAAATKRTATHGRVVPQRGGAIRSRAGGGDRKRQKQGHGQEADGASHDAIAEQESRAGAESAEPSDGPKYAALRRALLAVSNPGESFRSADVANWLEQVHREGPTPLWKERSARVKYIRRQLESLSQKGFVVQKGKAKQGSDKQFTLTDRGRAVVEQGLRAAGGEACGGAAAGVAAGAAAGGEAAAGGNAGGARLERLEQRMTAIETNVHSKVDRMMAMLEQLTAQ